MSSILLGIDPGLQKAGWGAIRAQGNHLSFLACGTIRTNAGDALATRLHTLHNGLAEVIHQLKPDQAAIEETFVSVNGASTLKLGQARGAILLALSLHGLPVSEYAATQVKKSIVGVGRAEKAQVEMMVKQLLPGAKCQTSDEADALAIALCHAHHRTLSRVLAATL